MRCLHNEHPEINTAYLRQDNAGCYHSAGMVMACHLMEASTGVKIRRVDFSDPQGGKGPCDRKAATVKAHVRRFVNEGNDVLTAENLRDAVLSNGGVRGVRVTLVDGSKIKPLPPVKWEGVSHLNNFLYAQTSVTAWKAYKIGRGKKFLWSQLQGTMSTILKQKTYHMYECEKFVYVVYMVCPTPHFDSTLMYTNMSL